MHRPVAPEPPGLRTASWVTRRTRSAWFAGRSTSWPAAARPRVRARFPGSSASCPSAAVSPWAGARYHQGGTGPRSCHFSSAGPGSARWWRSPAEGCRSHTAGGPSGRTPRSLADPWGRVPSRRAHPGSAVRRPIAPAAGPRAGVVRPPRPVRRGHPLRRSSWLDEASASPVPPGPRPVPSGAPARSMRRASSRCSPAPCARSRPRPNAAAFGRRGARRSRSSPCWCGRSGPVSRPTRASGPPGGPSS